MVALIVGAILNLINQGDVLWGDARLNVTKMLLTFAVPYCVATYGAASYRLRPVGLTAQEHESSAEEFPVSGDPVG